MPPAADFAAAPRMIAMPLRGGIDNVSGPRIANRGWKCVQRGNSGLDADAAVRRESICAVLFCEMSVECHSNPVESGWFVGEAVFIAQQQCARLGGKPGTASGRRFDSLQRKFERIMLIQQQR